MKEWTFRFASQGAEPLPVSEDSDEVRWDRYDHVVLLEEDGWLYPGVAICSLRDQYSRKRGWQIARGRAGLSQSKEKFGVSWANRPSVLNAMRAEGRAVKEERLVSAYKAHGAAVAAKEARYGR